MQIVSTEYTQLVFRDRESFLCALLFQPLNIQMFLSFAFLPFDLKSATWHYCVNVHLRHLHTNHFSLQTGGKLTNNWECESEKVWAALSMLNVLEFIFFLLLSAFDGFSHFLQTLQQSILVVCKRLARDE